MSLGRVGYLYWKVYIIHLTKTSVLAFFYTHQHYIFWWNTLSLNILGSGWINGSTFRNGLSAPDSAFRPNVTLVCFRFLPQCDISVLPAGGEQQKAESMLTLALSRAFNLPWPNILEHFVQNIFFSEHRIKCFRLMKHLRKFHSFSRSRLKCFLERWQLAELTFS